MLETTKKYLLSGYLREQDINIHKLFHGIGKLITTYFDDSAMNFEIGISDLCKSNGHNKLHGKTFKLH